MSSLVGDKGTFHDDRYRPCPDAGAPDGVPGGAPLATPPSGGGGPPAAAPGVTGPTPWFANDPQGWGKTLASLKNLLIELAPLLLLLFGVPEG